MRFFKNNLVLRQKILFFKKLLTYISPYENFKKFLTKINLTK